MNHRTLSSEGRRLPGTSWNHTEGTEGEAAFRGWCSLIVPHLRFKRASAPSLFEVTI